MTTERPILMSAPMIRAILAGTKTQTRRVVKWSESWHPDTAAVKIIGIGAEGVAAMPYDSFDRMLGGAIRFPYGQPGDRLWVRETWLTVNGDDTFFRADYLHDPAGDRAHGVSWKPSIHMPRTRSRISLEVTGVRVERLQAISEADARSEGIVETRGGYGLPAGEHYHAADPRQSYFSLWEAINGSGSVDANPWVWVVSFLVVKP